MKRNFTVVGLAILLALAAIGMSSCHPYRSEMEQNRSTLEACKAPIESNPTLKPKVKQSYLDRIDASEMAIDEALKTN